jgi:hypothetical protein
VGSNPTLSAKFERQRRLARYRSRCVSHIETSVYARSGRIHWGSFNLWNPCAVKRVDTRSSQLVCLDSSGVEREPEEFGVGGSNPSPGTKQLTEDKC